MTLFRSCRPSVLTLAAVFGAAALACGGGDAPTDPGPQLDIAGTFTLRTVNGALPPVNIDPGNPCTARIVGNGSLAFTAVRQVAIRWEVDPGCAGTPYIQNSAGDYRTDRGAIVLDASPADTIRVRGDTATLVTHRTRPIATMVFVR